MAINRIDLLNHDFPRSLRGYSPKDVDAFIQELADTLASFGEEKLDLTNKISSLESKLREFEQREASLRETLVATQRMLDDIKNSAQREAQLIIEAARAKAESLEAQGEQRLARVLDEISEAQRIKTQFEFQVRSVIEGHLRLLHLSREDEEKLFGSSPAFNARSVRRTDEGRNAPPEDQPGHVQGGSDFYAAAERNKGESGVDPVCAADAAPLAAQPFAETSPTVAAPVYTTANAPKAVHWPDLSPDALASGKKKA